MRANYAKAKQFILCKQHRKGEATSCAFSFSSKTSEIESRAYPPGSRKNGPDPRTGGRSILLHISEYKAGDPQEERRLFRSSGKIQPDGPRRQEKRIQEQKPLQDLTEEAKRRGKPDKKTPNHNTLPYHIKTERPTHSENRTTTRRNEASLHDFRKVLHTQSV